MYQGRGEVINDRANKRYINGPGKRDGDARRVVGEPLERLKPSLETIQQVTDERMGLTPGGVDW